MNSTNSDGRTVRTIRTGCEPMRMDVSGSILMLVGVITNVVTAWFAAGRAWWVLLIASFVFFLGWVFIISGLNNLGEVRKDKKARFSGRPGIPPSVMHPGMQEPPPPLEPKP